MRYAQASAVVRTMQAGMRTRSRLERPAAGDKLSTPPGKRCVLAVVLAGCIVPRQTERVYMALRRMGEGEAIRRGMTRVIEVQRRRGIGIDTLGALSGQVKEGRR